MECPLKNITVHYEVRGEGRPILMLHGRPLDHRHILDEMEPLFADHPGWKRIYPDLPGMGQTPGPDWITHQDQVLDVLLEFIDQVFPGERFCVAGISYGGYLVRGMVYRRAAQIDGALLVVPAMIMEYERRINPAFTVIHPDPAFMATLDPALRAEIASIAVVQNAKAAHYSSTLILPAVAQANMAFIERTNHPCAFSFEADLPSVTLDKPTLILTGRQDHICGYQQAWEALEQFPRASFAILDRAGHCLPNEQEPLFRALVAEWLDRVEEAIAAR